MSNTDQLTPFSRRADVDYLRVVALLLLIIYHVLLTYDSSQVWRVQSSYAGAWAGYLLGLFAPWRILLVFFIGGIAARYMLDKFSTRDFVRDRASKLLTAFVFAVLILVPPQRYVRLQELGEPAQGYFTYLLHGARYVKDFHGLWLPDIAHAWFLPYLFVYSVAVLACFRVAPKRCAVITRGIERIPLWVVVGAFGAWLCFIYVVIEPRLPVSRLLIPDITGNVTFFPIFALGVLVGKSEVFRVKLVRILPSLCLAACTLLVITLALRWQQQAYDLAPTSLQAATGLYAGVMVFALSAVGVRYLNKPSAFMAYVGDAILPVYLMHQTVQVVVADAILARHLPLAVEMAILFVAALFIPLAIYELFVRRTPFLRVLFGLRMHLRNAPVGPVPGGMPEPQKT